MNNIKELIKKSLNVKYSKKDKKTLIKRANSIIGAERHFMMCTEEIAELVEVISDNIENKFDYIHTVEEIVDVYISIEIIKEILSINDSSIAKISKKKNTSKKKSIIFSSIITLSKSQQQISKLVRGKNNNIDKVIGMINSLNECLYDLEVLFKIKPKDKEKVETLKYKRLEERILYGTLA